MNTDYNISHKSGWTIYCDAFGCVYIRGNYKNVDEFPDLAKMNSLDCFTAPLPQALPQVKNRQRVTI